MNPNIDYIPMSPLAVAVRNTMQPTEHGGGAKKVVAVVAAVAVPFVAPAISASIGLSASIGATAGSALTGAVLGGATSAATGGDWKRGALMGGIAGGIAGYASTPSATPSDVPVVDKSWSSGDILNADGTITSAPGGDPLLAPSTPTVAAPTVEPMIGPLQADGTYGGLSTAQMEQVGMTGLEYDDALLYDQGFTGGGATESSMVDSLGNTNTAGTNTAGTNTAGNAGLNTNGAGQTPPPAAAKTGWEGFKEGLNKAYSAENLGKTSMQMAGNALVNSMVGTSYTAEQQQLIDQRRAEVERLEAQGAEVDKIKLAEARKLLQQAMQVDPTYLARQKANAAKNQASRATNEAVRRAGGSGRQAGLVESVRRRGALAGGKHSASAFDAGYQGGLQEKLALQESGLKSLPDSKGLSGYYTSLGTQYANAEEARDKERAAYNKLFGQALT